MRQIIITKRKGIYSAECEYGFVRAVSVDDCKLGIMRLFAHQELIQFVVEDKDFQKPEKRVYKKRQSK